MTARFRDALAALNRGELRLARSRLREVVAGAGPWAPWACQQLIQSLAQRGQWAAADREVARIAATGDPGLADLAFGYLARRRGRATEARPALARAATSSVAGAAAQIELAAHTHAAGDVQRAERALRRTETALGRRGDEWGVAACLALGAALSVERGQDARGLVLAQRAVALRTRLGDRLGLGVALQIEAKAGYRAGQYPRAFARLSRARDIHVAGRHHYEAAVVENNLGLWHLDLASPGLAATHFAAARRLFRRLGDRPREAAVVANLANACRQAGDYPGGVRAYRRALGLLAHTGSTEAYAIALAEMAELLTRWGRGDEAQRLLHRGRARLRGASPATIALGEVEKGRAALALGRPAAALRLAAAASNLVHDLKRSALGRVTVELKAGLLVALSRLALGNTGAASLELDRLERTLHRLLARQSDPWVRMGLNETYREAGDARIRTILVGQPERAREGLSAATNLKSRELRGQAADAMRLRNGATPPLPPGVVLVEYHVAHDTTWAFVLEGADVRAVDLGMGERALGAAVDRLLKPLHVASRSANPRPWLLNFDLGLAYRIQRTLLGPWLGRTTAPPRRLVVIPDGPLHRLPFELLVCEPPPPPSPSSALPLARFATTSFLGDRLDLSYARSARWLTTTSTLPIRLERFLGLSFSPRRSTTTGRWQGDLRLGPLPGARREVEQIARCFASSTIRDGRSATARGYRELAPRAHVIHFAAHAFADGDAPGASGIVLAGGPDAHLSAEVVREVPLEASLVTLSACDSGGGPLRAREGTIGLARAFLEAGAAAVVASLWPVDDRATLELMVRFYRRLAAGEVPAEALGGARRELRRACGVHLVPPRAHPAFWAPFVLIERQAPGAVGLRETRRPPGSGR